MQWKPVRSLRQAGRNRRGGSARSGKSTCPTAILPGLRRASINSTRPLPCPASPAHPARNVIPGLPPKTR
ncbi:MAG: hypothetical protein AB1894_01560 [Chloroflexota bacterium]